MKLEELRIKKGITQKELSKELGLKPSVISGYETGRTAPSVDVAIKIANYFNVSLDYLFERKESRFEIGMLSNIQLSFLEDIRKLTYEQISQVRGYIDSLLNKNDSNNNLTNAQRELIDSIKKLTEREVERASGYIESMTKMRY